VDLKASTEQLQWFVNAYVLSFACLLMTGAALGDRFGRRRVFTLGIVLFTLASAGCGLADTSGQLITFRVIQGFGAAAVMPLSLTLLSHAVPERLRGLALGLWSGISGLRGRPAARLVPRAAPRGPAPRFPETRAHDPCAAGQPPVRPRRVPPSRRGRHSSCAGRHGLRRP
jgi:nitrate/nitrite transporter NarK